MIFPALAFRSFKQNQKESKTGLLVAVLICHRNARSLSFPFYYRCAKTHGLVLKTVFLYMCVAAAVWLTEC